MKAPDSLIKNALSILDFYRHDFVLFKPRFYDLAEKYKGELHALQQNTANSPMTNVTLVMGLYKRLIVRRSEKLATLIGCELAEYFNIERRAYLEYRDAKIWTQRYIAGMGAFECRVYYRDGESSSFRVERDPVYASYMRLKNQEELSKVDTRVNNAEASEDLIQQAVSQSRRIGN